MNAACESDARVQNEHAVRCSLVTKPAFMIEYIKAISTLVGASHILAVFEENDAIKVFFDDKRHVETLIRNCLHVMGHHVRVDYVVPPGTKLILSNVDPVISDYDIMRLLAGYGSIVSPVFRPPISDELELCHIGYGVRYVYMELNGCVPERIEFKYGNELCYLKIQVDDRSAILLLPDIKTDTVEEENRDEVESNSTVRSLDIIPGPSGVVALPNLESTDPILVSVQSISENNSKEEIPFLTQQSLTMKVSSSELSIESSRTKATTMKRPRGRPPASKRKEITAVSKAAKRIRRNVKHKWIKRRYKKGKCGRKPLINTSVSLRSVCVARSSTPSSSSSTLPDLTTLMEQKDPNLHDIVEVLDEKQLQMYLEEVKHHRAPLTLAKIYIGEDCDSNKINKFIDQLNEYSFKRRKDVALRNRVCRLIKSITDALSSEDLHI